MEWAVEKETSTEDVKRTDEMGKTRDYIKSLLNKRKLRIDVDAAKAHSAPTSPVSNISVLDLTWNEEEARSVKRLKGDERGEAVRKDNVEEEMSGPERLAAKTRRTLMNLDKEIRVVAELARERNTKKEIKEAAIKLRSLMSQITTQETQALLQTLGKRPGVNEEVPPELQQGLLEEKDKEIGRLREQKIALEKENRKLKDRVKQLQNAGERQTVEERMFQEAETYSSFEEMEKLSWPKNIFKVAFPAAGSPLTVGKDTDILVLQEEGSSASEYNCKANEVMEQRFRERHPELAELEGRVAAITINTRVIRAGVAIEGNDKWIIRAELDLDGGSKEWFNTLLDIREMMVKGGRKKLSVYSPSPDPEGAFTRKALEYIFRKTRIKCLVHIRPQKDSNTQVGTRARKNTSEALVLSQPGKSYAELTRTIREKVKPGTTPARAIRTIREAKDGKMVVVLDKDVKAAEALRRELDKVQDLKIKKGARGGDSTIFINDIDSVTTKEEVLQMVCQETGAGREQIRIGEIREAYGGNQRVSIRIPKSKAEALINKRGIRIGLSWCPVKERVEVVRCFRCWGYDHYGRECKAEDRSQLCRKCGGKEHRAKDCNGQAKCLTCNEENHETGSGKCPEFRAALKAERERRARTRKS